MDIFKAHRKFKKISNFKSSFKTKKFPKRKVRAILIRLGILFYCSSVSTFIKWAGSIYVLKDKRKTSYIPSLNDTGEDKTQELADKNRREKAH